MMSLRNSAQRITESTEMKYTKHVSVFSVLSVIFVPVFVCQMPGCSNRINSGQSTALSGIDLIEMTDDMAMKIAGDPEVQSEIQNVGPLKIVVQPVLNEMTAEVFPRGPAEAFTGRVRSLLSKHDRERYVWIMNRDAFYRMRGQELDFDPGPSPDAINPEYALTARFSSLTNENNNRRSSYYLCVYQLTDLSKRRILWTDRYEVKKSAVKGFLD